MTHHFRNLLLVSYDCSRADVAYSGVLPTLAGWGRGGTPFPRAISSAPLTPVSHATVFTGQQPFRHGLRHLFREPLKKKQPVLAARLRRSGFQTGGVVSC